MSKQPPEPSLDSAPISVQAHRDRVRSLIAPTPVQAVPVTDCLGLVLAENLVSPIPLPPFDNSAMDGYAVRSVDLAGHAEPVLLPVIEDIPAGRAELPPLLPGTAHRIMTGAPVPAGADAVVPVELTDGGVDEVLISDAPSPGAHIRRAGEDVTAGQVVLRAGTVLGAPQLGLAAAVGAAVLTVHRRPRVLVLSTGSELVAPGEPLRGGQIYESNGVMLAAAVTEAGANAEILRFVPDDVDALLAAISPRLGTVDVLLTSGGVSAGAYEVVKDTFTGQGVDFVKVAMQPGGPQGSGRFGGVPVVTLPGNPVSSLVSFEVFVRPALLAAAGHTEVDRPRSTGRLTEALRSPSGRRQYRRGYHHAGSGTVDVVGGPGSHLLSALAEANCLIEIPEGVDSVPEGGEVTVLHVR